MASPRTGVYAVGRGGEGEVTTPENADSLDPAVVTIAESLQGAGYATGHVGKWHLGDPAGPGGPERSGFGFSVGAARGGGVDSHLAPWRVTGLADAAAGTPITDRLTDEAIGFVEEHAGEPFFLFVSHYAVHTPIEADPARLARVRARSPRLDEEQAAYAALIETLDDDAGRLLAALDAAGVADDTVVVFASDHGGHRRYADQGGLAGWKGTLMEGGIRVPLLVRWPGVTEAGRVEATPVQLFDLYPTFLDLAGAGAPAGQPVDGRSWLPLIRGDGRLEDRALVWYQPVYATSPRGRTTAGPVAAVRRGAWKLLVDLETGGSTLHHLADDPGERTDLAAREPAVVHALAADLAAWQRDTGAPVLEPVAGGDAGERRRPRGNRGRAGRE